MRRLITITILISLSICAMDSNQVVQKNNEQATLAETCWADMPLEVKLHTLSFLADQTPVKNIKQLKQLARVSHEFQNLVNARELMQANIANLCKSGQKKAASEQVLLAGLFINACKSGDLMSAQYFKDSGIDLEATDNCHKTALYWAVQHGHKSVTQYLLNTEAKLNVSPLLLLACSDNHKKVIEMLLKENSFSYGTTLHPILQPNEENLRTLQYALALVGPHTTDSAGATPLMYAAACGNIDLVSLLIRNKMRINIKDKYGCTALIAALVGRHFEVAELLISHGADINVKYMNSESLLVFAVENAHTDIVRFLIAHGADVNAKMGANETALMVAARKGFSEVAKLLIDANADINAKSYWHRTALEQAATFGHTELVQLLIAHAVDVSVANKERITPLMFAAKNGHAEIVSLLLSAIGNRKRDNGWFSFLSGFMNKSDLVNPQDRFGNSALIYAAKSGHKDVVNLLLAHNAQVNVQGDNGMSALMWAAQKGYLEIVNMLITAGADITLASQFYGNAIAYARTNGHNDIVKLLQDQLNKLG